ncbi:MAG: S8 family serine peptidase, partial [Steroidobacteraceae bacterium]
MILSVGFVATWTAQVPLALAAAPVALPVQAASQAKNNEPRFLEGVVLVGFKPGTARSERANARAAAGAVRAEAISPLATDAEKLILAPGRGVKAAIEALKRNPNVRYAEPDYILTKAAVSNDTYYTNNSLWGMYGDATSPANQYGSQAGEAWALGYTGSNEIYIGVIDEGIQVTHPDLQANIWVNPFETAGDGVDNDGNGKADDVHGWDFVNNDASVYDAGGDAHGTHVSGTIGGVGGNGTGVAGVNWNVTMISGKFLGTSGGSTSGAIAAVDYMNDLKSRHGLNIVATSNSWGGGGFSQALLDAINRGGDRDILFIAAAGNSNSNNDAGGYYPSGYQCTNGGSRGWDCVISVASITSSGAKSSFSQYGATTVDLGAPGSGVWSSVPTNSYASYNGTSMATPHVSGAAALCASLDPNQSGADLREKIMASTAPTASLNGITVTGGRLDVGSLAPLCVAATDPVTGAPASLTAEAIDESSIFLQWSAGTTANASFFDIERAPAGCAAGDFTRVARVSASATSHLATGLASETEYCFQVRAGNYLPSQTAATNTASATTLAPPPPPPPYYCSATASDWIQGSVGAVTLGDDASANYYLPFNFPFYGEALVANSDTFAVSSNGFLMLGGSSGATSYSNVDIPTAATPNGFVAPWWDDFNPSAGGTVRTFFTGSAPSRRLVVSWEGVPHFSLAGSTYSFQAVLEEATGDIVLNYQDVTGGSSTYDRGASATVGVESPDGAHGTRVSYNSATLSDGTSIRCSYGEEPPPPPSPPATPSGLSATADSWSQVTVSWTDVADETGYELQRAIGTGGFATIANLGADVTSRVDTGLSGSTTYRYRVRASNAGGASSYSTEASVTTPAAPPATPTLTATAVSATQVNLSWTNVANESGYRLQRDGADLATPAADATSFQDTGATAGTTYTYRVQAWNAQGDSNWSTVQTTTRPAAPTGLTATAASDTSINLSWTDVAGETGYKIEQSNQDNASWGQVTTTGANVTSLSRTGL